MFVNHVFLAAHCSAELNLIADGNDFVAYNSCHENLVQALDQLPAIHVVGDEAERRARVQFLAGRNDVDIFEPNQIIPMPTGSPGARCSSVPRSPTVSAWRSTLRDVYLVAGNCPSADQNLPFNDADPDPTYFSVRETGIAPETDDHPSSSRAIGGRRGSTPTSTTARRTAPHGRAAGAVSAIPR